MQRPYGVSNVCVNRAQPSRNWGWLIAICGHQPSPVRCGSVWFSGSGLLEGELVGLGEHVAGQRFRVPARPGLGRVFCEEAPLAVDGLSEADARRVGRSEEHTSELQSLIRNTYAVSCLKNK